MKDITDNATGERDVSAVEISQAIPGFAEPAAAAISCAYGKARFTLMWPRRIAHGYVPIRVEWGPVGDAGLVDVTAAWEGSRYSDGDMAEAPIGLSASMAYKIPRDEPFRLVVFQTYDQITVNFPGSGFRDAFDRVEASCLE